MEEERIVSSFYDTLTREQVLALIDNMTGYDKYLLCKDMGYVPGNIDAYMWMFLFIAVILLVCLVQWRRIKARKWCNVPTEISTEGDFERATVLIPSFLAHRARICGLRNMGDPSLRQHGQQWKDYDDLQCKLMYHWLDKRVLLFFRVCHAAGCEVIIRQRKGEEGWQDIENPDNDDNILYEICAKVDKKWPDKLRDRYDEWKHFKIDAKHI